MSPNEVKHEFAILILLTLSIVYTWWVRTFNAPYCIISKTLHHLSFKGIGECHSCVCVCVLAFIRVCVCYVYSNIDMNMHTQLYTHAHTWRNHRLISHEDKYEFELLILLTLASIFTLSHLSLKWIDECHSHVSVCSYVSYVCVYVYVYHIHTCTCTHTSTHTHIHRGNHMNARMTSNSSCLYHELALLIFPTLPRVFPWFVRPHPGPVIHNLQSSRSHFIQMDPWGPFPHVCVHVCVGVCMYMHKIYTHIHAGTYAHRHIHRGHHIIPGWSLTAHEVKHEIELLIFLTLPIVYTWWVRIFTVPLLYNQQNSKTYIIQMDQRVSFLCVWVCMPVCVNTFVCVCIYMYDHIHTCTCTHNYMHLCIPRVHHTKTGWSLTHYEVKHEFELLRLLTLASGFHLIREIFPYTMNIHSMKL